MTSEGKARGPLCCFGHKEMVVEQRDIALKVKENPKGGALPASRDLQPAVLFTSTLSSSDSSPSDGKISAALEADAESVSGDAKKMEPVMDTPVAPKTLSVSDENGEVAADDAPAAAVESPGEHVAAAEADGLPGSDEPPSEPAAETEEQSVVRELLKEMVDAAVVGSDEATDGEHGLTAATEEHGGNERTGDVPNGSQEIQAVEPNPFERMMETLGLVFPALMSCNMHPQN
mmetsp:Transcript_32833/g.93180  ORF Transcript_32833/g.93180 Transcript_32833/m.93180 type:complete len:232 (+) Transcript_32833:217-912(+)|eukprot:CAMPEP_0117684650 /NCGR_PEP_ID=MMETSP0804-20121206/21233_1 /TAXON_ID=1074897 /ORGANISM="Tetraselmis astigmatica, Strain CCMP880" /LENGTH=231 /DNA_ID=CAMNT_0005495697 /DNA_START=154 /DNA_END=849 /DNA_ORIENTATION=+